jgi:hypothetical protein
VLQSSDVDVTDRSGRADVFQRLLDADGAHVPAEAGDPGLSHAQQGGGGQPLRIRHRSATHAGTAI